MKLSSGSAIFLLASGLSRGSAFVPTSLIPRQLSSLSMASGVPIVVGAGVCGAASAIALSDAGLNPILIDQRSDETILYGAGINLQPKAVDALNSLGVPTSLLAEAGVTIKTQCYYLPDGRLVATLDKSGDGSSSGQIAMHQGKLVSLLHDVAKAKNVKVLMEHHISDVDQKTSSETVSVRAKDAATASTVVLDGTMVLGCDGINSKVRRYNVSGNGSMDPRRYHGTTHYRGVVDNFPSVLDGETMVLVCGKGVKVIVYPIGKPNEDGLQKINWWVDLKEESAFPEPDYRAKHIIKNLSANGFDLGLLDLESLISKTSSIMTAPMCDLDPLETWTDSRIGLVGDAAHGMLPVGSGGAMSALFDAFALSKAFKGGEADSVREKLSIYQEMRIEDASAAQKICRQQPAEKIIAEILEKFPAGTEVPSEYEERIREVMAPLHNPSRDELFGSVWANVEFDA